MVSLVFLLLQSCTTGEFKYCYYQDNSHMFIDKSVVTGDNVREAKLAREYYQSIRPRSIREFDSTILNNGLNIISGERGEIMSVEVVRYYPSDSVAKVISRATEPSPTRLDTRVIIAYVPMLLLHDSLPAVDTVGYIEY